MDDIPISELTTGQLQKLIRKTVQEAVAEVLLEFTIAAELEAEVTYQAEITDCLRSRLQEKPYGYMDFEPVFELDD